MHGSSPSSSLSSSLPSLSSSSLSSSWYDNDIYHAHPMYHQNDIHLTFLLQIYFFNTTNPEAFLRGEKAVLQEVRLIFYSHSAAFDGFLFVTQSSAFACWLVRDRFLFITLQLLMDFYFSICIFCSQVGPYIYEEKWDKVEVDWQNDTVTYRLRKFYKWAAKVDQSAAANYDNFQDSKIMMIVLRWRQDLSYPLQETDRITLPNVPMFVSILLQNCHWIMMNVNDEYHDDDLVLPNKGHDLGTDRMWRHLELWTRGRGVTIIWQ